MLDTDSVPLEGERTVTYRLFDAAEGGATVWEETVEISLTNGFYTTILGAEEEDNPLDIEVLEQAPLWLAIQLEGEAPMYPRTAIHSVPYATLAGSAEQVSGGTVNASEVSILGTPVIDEDGRWVGEAPTISWDDLTDKPADIEAPDTVLSGDEVREHVTSDPIDLAPDSSMGESILATVDDLVSLVWSGIEDIPADFADGVDNDILSSLEVECGDGHTPHWDDATLGWVCTEDLNTQLSMSDVLSYVTESVIDLATGTTLGGLEVSTGSHTTSLDWSSITGVPDAVVSGGVPSGTVIFYNGETCPDGYSELLGAQGRYLVGRTPGGTLGAAVGTELADQEDRATGKHTHDVNDPGHQHGLRMVHQSGNTYSGTWTATPEPRAETWTSDQTSDAYTDISIVEAGTTEGTSAPYLQLTICERD